MKLAQTNGFFINRESDKKILNAFSYITENFNSNIVQITITLSTLDTIIFKNKETPEKLTNSENLTIINKSTSFNISKITILFINHSIEFKRGAFLENPTPIFDYIENIKPQAQNLSIPPFKGIPQLSIDNKLSINSQLQRSLAPISSTKVITNNLPKEYEEIVSQHSNILSKLEELNSDLIIKNQEQSQKLEQSYQEKMRSLESSNNEKNSELENIHNLKNKSLEEDFLKKSKVLDDREEKLKKKLVEIDNRGNTIARREIRDNMLKDVKERVQSFSVSPKTSMKRYPVLIGIVGLLSVITLMFFLTVIELNNYHTNQSALSLKLIESYIEKSEISSAAINSDTSKSPRLSIDNNQFEIYWIWFRLALLSFSIFGTILFYIKWQNKWAEKHSDTEFNLQQFHIDVNRANWVLESCLEWKKETGEVMPKELIESFSKNLFETGEHKQDNVIHPADELASALMGSASKLKVKAGDNEIEFDKPKNIPNNHTVKE